MKNQLNYKSLFYLLLMYNLFFSAVLILDLGITKTDYIIATSVIIYFLLALIVSNNLKNYLK